MLTRALDLVAYASDASPYRLIPQAVAMPHDVVDVVKLLAFARDNGTSIVFRAGGTSLNGQAQTDQVLVDVRRYWQRIQILEHGAAVRVSPGTVLGRVNRRSRGTAASSAPIRRAPRLRASAGLSPTTRAACAAGWSLTPTGRSAR